MDGSLFYWIFWLIWVYLTFFFKKQNSWRIKLSAIILVVIIFSAQHIHIAGFDLSVSSIFLLFTAYATLHSEKTHILLYFFICSFIVMIAYVSFHLFEIYDPVWLIFNKEWMMGVCIAYLAILLQKELKGRVLIIFSGTIQGEILYAYILSRYDFPYAVGSLACLDTLSLTVLLLIGWSFIEKAGSFFEGYVHTSQKEKQKLS